MKINSIILLTIFVCSRIHAQETCHFNKVEIDRDDVRLMELASVIEFRCDCIIPESLIDKSYKGNKFRLDTQFLAERYQDGKCVSREWFSVGKHPSANLSKGNFKSVISFGWNMENQKLVGVNDTGFFHLPGFVKLPAFHSSRPRHFSFFKDSKPEPRKANDGLAFDLYPIIGIRGSKARSSIDANGYPRAPAFQPGLRSTHPSSEELIKTFRKQPDSVIVYLYIGGATPKDYEEIISEQDGIDKPIKMQNKSEQTTRRKPSDRN